MPKYSKFQLVKYWLTQAPKAGQDIAHHYAWNKMLAAMKEQDERENWSQWDAICFAQPHGHKRHAMFTSCEFEISPINASYLMSPCSHRSSISLRRNRSHLDHRLRHAHAHRCRHQSSRNDLKQSSSCWLYWRCSHLEQGRQFACSDVVFTILVCFHLFTRCLLSDVFPGSPST